VFERFTDEARSVVVHAQAEARATGAAEVGPVHLLLGVAEAGGSGGQVLADAGATGARLRAQVTGAHTHDADALAALGIDLQRVRAAADAAFGAGALDAGRPAGATGGRVRFAGASRKALEQSLRAALRRGDRRIGTDHVLAGVLAVGDPSATAVLTGLGIDPDHLRRRLDGEAAA
jgi:ATP-dependent Clp protease ATP-binding subunit ClpA